MEKSNIIVFSKNRGCQLELFLRSMNKMVDNVEDNNVIIIYKYTTDDYKKGYDLVKRKYNNFTYVDERDIKSDILHNIDNKLFYTVFFVDDIIFKNKFSFNDDLMKKYKESVDVICLSLRLAPHLTHCYTMNASMKKPEIIDNRFDWRRSQLDFNYPMSLDGHIFKTNEILPILRTIGFNSPTVLEGRLMDNKDNSKPYMMCYNESIIVNNPCNRVQTLMKNRYSNVTEMSENHLNQKFLQGFIIEYEPFIGFKNISCHQELKYNLIKDE